GGTSAAGEDGRVRYPGDVYLQAKEALAAIGVSLRRLGAGPEAVVRTRIYLKKSWQWAEVGKAHEEFFGGVLPATTFVGAGGFPDPDVLVEIEATAVAGDDRVRLAP
ncbi:MAG: Rid family hydrolase, partial [Actinomycetota bacterium]